MTTQFTPFSENLFAYRPDIWEQLVGVFPVEKMVKEDVSTSQHPYYQGTSSLLGQQKTDLLGVAVSPESKAFCIVIVKIEKVPGKLE